MILARMAAFLLPITLPLLLPVILAAQRPVPVDNERARVVVATSAPGPKGRMHKHDMNRVMIYLDNGAQQLEYQDGTKRDFSFRAGEVQWDPKGNLHTSQNRGGTTFRVVEVELKTPGGSAAWPANDPVRVAPDAYKVELDNEQVRVLRVKLEAGQSIPLHQHVLPRIVVPLTSLELKVTSNDGKESTLKGEPGQAFYGGAAHHREENAGPNAVELILVELKG